MQLPRTFYRIGLLALMYSVCFVPGAVSQAARGNIRGEVYDSSGARIPDAQVRIVEVRTNQTGSATADGGGYFTLVNLMPGTYRMTVHAQGFSSYTREGIQLATGENLRIDATLQIGSPSQSVTVTMDAPLLRSETGSLGQVIDSRKIENLPLNGRTFVSLVALSSGVALPPGSILPRINGGRPRVNEYLYDGISVLQPEPGTVAFFPIVDAIQEFKIETNSPPAEFGRFNGGVVNLTTRSGGNQFHGSVFEYFRNEALNARNFFAAADSKRPVFRRNQFGGSIGGPIRRDRTFFFADYQGTRQLIGRVRTSTVPTEKMRLGDFSELTTVTIYDPETHQPFPNQYIAPERRDKIASYLMENYYPHPTASGTVNNYTRVGNERNAQDQFDVRIDHHISNSDHAFGRYSYFRDDAIPVTPFANGSGAITTGTTAPTITGGQSIATGYIHEFGSTAANEFRFGYTRRTVDRAAMKLQGLPSDILQLPGIPQNGAFSHTMPTFVVGSAWQQLGPASNANSNFRTDVTEIVDQFYRQYGRHSLKAGMDWRWQRLDILQPPSPTGIFSFDSKLTSNNNAKNTGSALASFLLGQVQTFSIDLQPKKIRPRAHIQEYFIQDDWKASSRLTINAGVRWTLNFPSTEADNQGAVFNLETQKLDYLGRDGFPRSSRQLHWHDFGPRLGLAYRFGEKTVVRAGYGLIWIEQAGITTPFTNPQFPFIQNVTKKAATTAAPAFVLADGPVVTPVAYTPEAGLGQNVYTVDRSLGSGYVQQWNLFIQRELSPNMSFSIGYTGSKITHVGIPDANINQLTVQQLSLGSSLTTTMVERNGKKITLAQSLKPYPDFGTVSYYRNNVGNTNYHALQARLERMFSQSWSFLASYTFSRLIDEASSVFDATISAGPVAGYPVADTFNRKLERDVSTGDIPHVFVFSSIYELPFGPGRLLNPQGIAGKVANGWKLSGLLTLQSGVPLAIKQSPNYNEFAGFDVQRPNRVADPNEGALRTTGQWFNTAAFELAPAYTLGSSSRNPVRGPGYQSLDIALSKQMPIRESMNLEFRAEGFNVTNTPPLGAPNMTFTADKATSTFGKITTAGDPRVIQFALKLLF